VTASEARLVLASASPRRRQLLALLGRPFTVVAADVDESVHEREPAATAVERLAVAKAHAVGTSGVVVVGADTVVVLDGDLLGKPRDDAHAIETLRRLSGRAHEVLTGVAVVSEDEVRSWVVATSVEFGVLAPEQIHAYVAGGEPSDKAGAYAIQGDGGRFVTEARGSWHNVVGLPLARLALELDARLG
jgi:septum formation protein